MTEGVATDGGMDIGERLPYELDLWFGSGPSYGYEPAVLPEGWWLGAVSAVATSPDGEVFVGQRGRAADPILVYDRDGRYVRSWGRGSIGEPHGLRLDPRGDLWLTDTEHQVVQRYSRAGELLQTLGRKGETGLDDERFNLPTDIGFGSDGVTYISDGYGNSRIVIKDRDGRHLGEWGRPGSGPGEFDTPHSLAVAPDGRVYVCDRSNGRLQRFAADGTFEAEWSPPTGSPQAITITPDGTCWLIAAIDSIAGRLYRLDLDTWRITGWLESPGHMLDAAPWGDLLVGSLSGNIVRWSPPADASAARSANG